MGLKIKTLSSILNSMSLWISSNSEKLINFYPGSVLRTLLESIASEIESLYFSMSKAFDLSIQDSIATSFNFYKRTATPSSGEITMVFKSVMLQQLVLPKGHRFYTKFYNSAPVYFESTEDTLIPYGSTSINVRVQCTQPGILGRVPAYSIRASVTPLDYVEDIYNTYDFLNGSEEETQEEYISRFQEFISTLSRGTMDSIRYGCLSTEGVTGVHLEEYVGYINAYVHDANGELPPSLAESVQKNLYNYRAGGIEVVLKPVIVHPLDISVEVYLYKGFDVETYKTMIQDSITNYLNRYSASKPFILASLTQYIMNLDNSAITNVRVLSPTSDISVLGHELIRPGVITVSTIGGE